MTSEAKDIRGKKLEVGQTVSIPISASILALGKVIDVCPKTVRVERLTTQYRGCKELKAHEMVCIVED